MGKEDFKYIFVDTIERENKEKTKKYKYACVCLISKTNCDLLQIFITDKQEQELQELVSNDKDITELISVEYNSYSKAYQPKINL